MMTGTTLSHSDSARYVGNRGIKFGSPGGILDVPIASMKVHVDLRAECSGLTLMTSTKGILAGSDNTLRSSNFEHLEASPVGHHDYCLSVMILRHVDINRRELRRRWRRWGRRRRVTVHQKGMSIGILDPIILSRIDL